MIALASIEFTHREIRLITAALPDNCNSRRLVLLPDILRDWSRADLSAHLQQEAPSTASKRWKQIAKVGKAVDDLIQAIGAMNKDAQLELALQIGIVEGLTFAAAVGREAQNRGRLVEFRNFTATLAAAAKKPLWKRGRGRPRNIRSILIMRDLAGMFEYVARLAPTRIVASNEECGPFYRFAGAVWPVIFGAGDAGLPAAIKSWAWARTEFPNETSAVIANIAIRHPEWGLFDK